MASVKDLKSSKYLKKEDVGAGKLVTIASVHQENIAKDGADPEYKWCLSFNEAEKPMVLNATNGEIIARITGISEDIEVGWVGKKVVLYEDPNITYGGKLVGGIRVRAPKKTAAAPVAPAPADDPANDLPF